MERLASCPLCGIRHTPYMVQLHVDRVHGEESSGSTEVSSSCASSPSSSDDAGSSRSSADSPVAGDRWTKCTRPGCGQYVRLSGFDQHLARHKALEANHERDLALRNRRPRSSYQLPHGSARLQNQVRPHTTDPRSIGLLRYFSGTLTHGRSSSSSSSSSSTFRSSQSSRVPPRSKNLRQPQRPGRLGKRELGPYAFEQTMPDHVRRHLLDDARPQVLTRIRNDGRLERFTIIPNQTPSLIPVLADLCARVSTTAVTYFCDPSVRHIMKIQCEGNFCGYWNIQVLLTYLRRHHDGLRGLGDMPSVLHIQDAIEQAWANDICAYGKVETGGVRGSRKWIGTHEALAYFTQIGVQVEALSFREDENGGGGGGGDLASVALLDHVEAYFMRGIETAHSRGSSRVTGLPPIYLQRFGHSMSIVGIERARNGHRNLLVFDSSFATTRAMKGVLEGKPVQASVEQLLGPYRRSDDSLARWEEFEIIA
nr:zinc finger with ufm1-specific peptidase domain protein [Quercus suber]